MNTTIYWDDDERSTTRMKCNISDDIDKFVSLADILKRYQEETNPLYLFGEDYNHPNKKSCVHSNIKIPKYVNLINKECDDEIEGSQDSKTNNKDEENKDKKDEHIIHKNDKVSNSDSLYNSYIDDEDNNNDDEYNQEILERISYRNTWYS